MMGILIFGLAIAGFQIQYLFTSGWKENFKSLALLEDKDIKKKSADELIAIIVPAIKQVGILALEVIYYTSFVVYCCFKVVPKSIFVVALGLCLWHWGSILQGWLFKGKFTKRAIKNIIMWAKVSGWVELVALVYILISIVNLRMAGL